MILVYSSWINRFVFFKLEKTVWIQNVCCMPLYPTRKSWHKGKKNCICKQQSSLQNTHQLNQRELRRIWEHNSIALGTEITSSTSEKGELKKYKLQQGRLANVLSLRQVASKIKITLKSNQRVIWIRIVIDLTLVQTTLRTREFARGYIAGRLQYLTTCRQQKPKRLCRAIS